MSKVVNLSERLQPGPVVDPGPWTQLKKDLVHATEAVGRDFARHKKRGQWYSAGFGLACQLRFHPLLRDLPIDEVDDLVNRAMNEVGDAWLGWHLFASADTKGSETDPFEDFILGWEKVKGGVLQEALRSARLRWSDTPDEFFGTKFSALRYQKFRFFLVVVRELALLKEGENVFVPVQDFGDLLDTSHQQASRWRQLAVRFGFLRPIKEAEKGRAAEFQWIGPC